MRIRLFAFILLLTLCEALPLKAQELVKNSSVSSVCYAGSKVNRIYIPPPAEFFRKGGSKSGASVTIYHSGFPSQAVPAIEYVAQILESVLPADAKVTIVAKWQQIPISGVLANTSITGYAGGWAIDALDPYAYYPVALAEKILGQSLNEDLTGDLILTVNSAMNWYMGTDGNTAVLAYDLVTVMLHEICHGLGFVDSMDTDGSVGWYGLNGIPLIYDTFIENLAGDKLTDTLKFQMEGAPLRLALTGGQLYFNGPLISNYTSGERAKLWAPIKWDPGSSVSHLDEDATIEPNTLMTPFIDRGEAIHDPGKYTLSILGDLGWINTRIIHEPLKDTEENLSEIGLTAVIRSDTLYNRDNVGIVYSLDNFLTSDTLYLSSLNSDDTFRITLDVPSYNTEIQYYFFVEDYFSRLYRSPSLYELFRYKVFIGADTVKPVISHTPVDYYLETVDSVSFVATAVDNKGIDTVYVEYKINEGLSKYIGLKAGLSDTYSAVFSAKPEMLRGGDSIQYRIIAVDSANIPNTAFLPDSGYFVTGIEGLSSVLQSYSTDFSSASSDFLNNGFEITQPDGFSSMALHSEHPYRSPEDNDLSYDFTALLRHPLKFDESGMFIIFKEVVLVEPGEPGSEYGSDDFYDYVIFEGSKDFGKTWFPLTDGYDSRYESTWEDDYNNSVVGFNSTFTGTESMLLKHTVFYRPSDDISAGDTMLFRFRLFSDPFANGWGWVIEDLKINPLIDAIEKTDYAPDILYPNPGNGHIRIRSVIAGNENSKQLHFRIFNSAGICVADDYIAPGTESLADISAFPDGLYIIVLYRDDGIRTYKYSLIR